jgi:LCP family protein required for cell wall assembly
MTIERRVAGSYRVYRVGKAEHIREVVVVPPRRLDRGRDIERTGSRRWLWWLLLLLACAAAAALYWRFGREMVANSQAAVDLVELSGKVPAWVLPAAPIIVVVALVLATAYFAFGHHLILKILVALVVAAALAAPGVAVGYANGLVADVGVTGTAADTQIERDQIVAADKEVDRPIPRKAMNILLIGTDESEKIGDPGRSDTQLLVRLDPETKSISMLSIPRDLQVEIPGVGLAKMNEAYTYGGPALVIKTFKQLTGLKINGWIETNFAGFWHVVNALGGVYLPIDHKYFVPASAPYKSINLEAGYQLVRGKQALNYVRYRHDQHGDFMRMQRQQLFLKELQRQSGRWSGDWQRVLRLIKAMTHETKSGFSSLKKIQPIVALAFEVNTTKVYKTHLEGATPMIGDISYVTATPEEVAAVVRQFTNPTLPPTGAQGPKIGKRQFVVRVYNGSGIPGLATTAASQLSSQGYNATAVADAFEFPGKTSAVYAPKGLEAQANTVARMLAPADVRVIERRPGTLDGLTVFVASSFDGTIQIPQEVIQERQTLLKNQKVDWSTWRQLDQETPLRLEAPTAWSTGFVYDEFRNYSLKTTEGKNSAASVAVVRTSEGGYWSLQAMRWRDPPAITNPNERKKINGRKYLLFYEGNNLHMIAWRGHGTLYWLLNTLDNQLSNDLMLGLATSCKTVK